MKYIKANIGINIEYPTSFINEDEIPAKEKIAMVLDTNIEIINKKTISHPIIVKEKPVIEAGEGDDSEGEIVEKEQPVKEEKEGFEQISIFDDLDD